MQRQRLFTLVGVIILSLCSIQFNDAVGSATAAEQPRQQQKGEELDSDGTHQHHGHGHDHPNDSHSQENAPRGKRNADERTEASGEEIGREAAGKSIRRHPVQLYKGADPWRPLSNSVPFGVSAVELPPAESIDEEEEEVTAPRELATANGPTDNVLVKVSGTLNGVAIINATDHLAESVPIDYTESVHKRSKNVLHESLRRPLRRLTDRQLALLLKQVRKQRRGQFGRRENEESTTNSRQEMLDQLKNLLKQPQDGQRLIRPKLLTNVNILPNEWDIYPPPRNIGHKNGVDQNLNEGQQQQGTPSDGRFPADQQKQSVQTLDIRGHQLEGLSGGEHRTFDNEAPSSSTSSSTSTQLPTSTADQLLTQPQFELKATIRPPIVQSVVLVPEQTTTTDSTTTVEQKLKAEDEANGNGTTTAAKLEANWQKEEQKFMAEMRTAVQKADSVMEKLENQRKESAQTDTAAILAPKSFDQNSKNNGKDKNDLTEFKVLNVSKFAEQERSELGELSEALREIRLRYETVKHEFQYKMKRMGLAHRFKTPTQFKAAGTTTFIEEEAQNGTNFDFGLELEKNRTAENAENERTSAEIGRNGTIENATDGTTTENNEKKTTTSREEEEHTTAVPIPNANSRNRKPTNGQKSAKNGNKNETTAEDENVLNVGKAKSKLTLAELADELEQIERTIATRKGKAGLKELEIESGTLQKAKKILQKDKKAKQKNRSRVSSSSLQSKGEATPKALANNGTAQSVAINKIVEKIKMVTALREGHHHQQQKKVEKQQQGDKIRGEKVDEHQTAKQTQQHQAVQPLPNTAQHQHQAVQPPPNIAQHQHQAVQPPPNIAQHQHQAVQPPPNIAQHQHQAVQNTAQHHQPSLNMRQTIPFVKITSKSRMALSQSGPSTAAELNKLKTVLVDTSTEQGQQHSADGQNQQEQHHNSNYHHHNQQQFNQQQFDHSQQQFQPVQHQQQIAQLQHVHQQSQHPQNYHQQQQQQQFEHPQLSHQLHPQQLNHASRHGQGQRLNVAGGGFYQLERAQVANVSQKTPRPPPPSELKLKGVAQVEAARKGTDHPQQQGQPEISNSQLSDRLRKEWLGKNGTKPPKEDDDLANLEEFAQIDELAICDAIACNFETGALCEWESSVDELNPGDPRYRRYMMARSVLLARHRRRSKRNVDEVVRDEQNEEEQQQKEGEEDETAEFGQNLLLTSTERTTKTQKSGDQRTDKQQPTEQQGARTVLRSWHNWVGRYRNRLTGIAQSEVFTTRNQRFAASYLKPGQRSTLTGRLLSGDRATIRFKAWEATRSLQLRVCCDRTDRDENCVFATELGVKSLSRKWADHLATCPQGTKKIIFECRNFGSFQGACGVDNIQLVNAYCPSVTPMKANRKLK